MNTHKTYLISAIAFFVFLLPSCSKENRGCDFASSSTNERLKIKFINQTGHKLEDVNIEGVHLDCIRPYTTIDFFSADGKYFYPGVHCSIDGEYYGNGIFCNVGDPYYTEGSYVYRLTGINNQHRTLEITQN